MKFIFPKNYKYRAKILGIIDYGTAIIDLLLGIVLLFLIKIFTKRITTIIYVFIILYVPVLLFSIFIAQGENIITYIIMTYKFFKRRGVYFCDKNYNDLEKEEKIEIHWKGRKNR